MRVPDFLNWFWKGCKPNSVCPDCSGERIICLGSRYPESVRFRGTGAGRSGIPYLALHPMGFSVPRRLRFARWSLTPPFHPCRRILRNAGGLIFCGTVRRKAFQPSARVCLNRTDLSYAASRPLVFGLSSAGPCPPSAAWPRGMGRQRFSALPKPGKDYTNPGKFQGGVKVFTGLWNDIGAIESVKSVCVGK